jgi:phosphatidate cytidylyltransferase
MSSLPSLSRLTRSPDPPVVRAATEAPASTAAKLARLAIFLGAYAVSAGIAWQGSAAVWTVAFAVLVLLVLCEFYALVELRSWPLRSVGVAVSAALLLRPLAWPELSALSILALAWIACLAVLSLTTTRPNRRELGDLLMTMCGALTVTVTLGQLIAIRYLPAGRAWVVLILATVAAREAGAALGGLMFPSAPAINPAVSPRKSYAGWLVGAAAALVTAVVFPHACGLALGLERSLVFGLALGAACQLGDLSESYIKRMMAQRHSSTLLGPQGGLCDTTDALAFAAVVARCLLEIWGANP